MPRFGGGNKCPRCSKTVYHAEEKKANGKSWHVRCYTCKGCGDGLTSTTTCDAKDEIWCKSCYGKNFGPKGYGYGGGAGTLQMSTASKSSKPRPPSIASSPPPIANSVPVSPPFQRSGHRACSKCRANVPGKFCSKCGAKFEVPKPKPKPKPKLTGCTCGAPKQAGHKFCTQCGKKWTVQTAPTASFSKMSIGGLREGKIRKPKKKTGGGKFSKFGGAPKCKRCKKTVYHAEAVMVKWHKSCFRCYKCGKGLSSTSVREHDDEIFCDGCYAKDFGPKGFGYGAGVHAVTK